MYASCFAMLSLLPNLAAAGTNYQMAVEYAGSNFFDGWTFFDNFDNLTNGQAIFLGESAAMKQKLAYVNDAGNAIMRVDNTSKLSFGDKRDTIHITSKDLFKVGSVWIADMLHVPYGCSVWPAFWSVAPNWPTGGEIDTFEGVNMELNNEMTLHTEPGCTLANATMTSTIINSTDCNFQDNGNSGCGVEDPNQSSFGAAFAAAGGGIYVTEFAETGISVWFFNRSSIPSSLQGNASSFDIASLGTPVANWPSSGCPVDTFFTAQNLVFDITLCGDLAGNTEIFAQTCTGDCYLDWVLGSPSNFDNAYFEVQSVKVFNNGVDTTIVGVSDAQPRLALPGATSWVLPSCFALLVAAAVQSLWSLL